MSGHLIGCTGAISGLGKSHKLALLAFADSADDRTHVAFPGYEGVQTWADCSRSRAAELIKDLVGAGYLRLHKTARPGRRAEYIVFPGGCCELHRTPVEETDPVDVDALAAAAGVSTDAVSKLLAAMTIHQPNGSEASDSNRSENSNPSQGNGSENSDPSGADPADASEISDSNAVRVQNGSGNGSETSDPFTTSLLTTPQPPASGGPSGCAKPGAPHANCRGCGTTNRQIAERERREAEERRRAEEQARLRREREQAAAVRAAPRSPVVDALVDEARRTLASNRGGGR